MSTEAPVVRRVGILAVLAVLAAGCSGSAPTATRTGADTSPPRVSAGLGHRIGHPVTADVDGDGRPDRAVLRVWGHQYGGLRDAVLVSLAGGRQLRLALPDSGTTRYPANRLLGQADVNGDGLSELVVFLSGNTAFSAAIVTLVGDRLVRARSPDNVPAFAAHGDACGQCTQDATCQPIRGHPRLVESFSTYLSRRGRDLTGFEQARTHDSSPPASHRRRWEATTYELRGPRLVRLGTFRGVLQPRAPLPSEYRFEGALNCGTAHWDIGSP